MESPPEPGPNRTEAQRNVRYAHLVGRLRNRQITMEEATELFGMMQGMLRTSEVARLSRAPPPEPKPRAPPRAPTGAVPRVPAPDDLLLAGILAMGAGAGLLAAISKRMTEGTAPDRAAPPDRPGTRAQSP